MVDLKKAGLAVIPIAIAHVLKPVLEEVGVILAEWIRKAKPKPDTGDDTANELRKIFRAVLEADSPRIDLSDFMDEHSNSWEAYLFDHGKPGRKTRKTVVVTRLAQTLNRLSSP